jgi:dihydrofolate synthase/folylpolyglutamate synthase
MIGTAWLVYPSKKSLQMTYPDSVRFLYALGNEIKSAKLGLERIVAVLAALGIPSAPTA